MQASYDLTDQILREFAPDFVGCSTEEPPLRPIPHSFAELSPQIQRLVELFTERGPAVYRFLLARIVPEDQTFDTKSRLGYPSFEVTPNKLGVLWPWFERFMKGDYSVLDNAFMTNNIRLQPERPTKERAFHFISDSGVVYERVITRKERQSEDGRIASRLRLVTNAPVINHWTNFADTALHNVQLKSPIMHFDMSYLAKRLIEGSGLIFLDVKHFERIVGALVPLHAQMMGHAYKDALLGMNALPYLVFSDIRKNRFLITPNKGITMQLGSGMSCVTSLAKAVMLVLFSEVETRLTGKTFLASLEAVYSGRGRLGVMSYGDDNVIFCKPGSQVDTQSVFRILEAYMPLEVEKPSKFLGYEYDEKRGFELPVLSYILNFYLAERAPLSRFRPFPHYGFVLRREVYREQGHPDIATKVFDAENDILKRNGIPVEEIYKLGLEESQRASKQTLEQIAGKEYLMTDEQKKMLPGYQVLGKDIVAKHLKRLVGYGA